MTVHCPRGNDHLEHRICEACGQPEYLAYKSAAWTHCGTGHCPGSIPAQAAELLRQYDQQCGPRPADPWDADVWAWSAARLLRTIGGTSG